MKFSLNYYGPIKSAGDAKSKHSIRMQLHNQMKSICTSPPFDHVLKSTNEEHEEGKSKPLYKNYGTKRFNFLVSEYLKTVVDLEIFLLLPQKVGAIVTNGGDIDNRIKTLFDALRIPASNSEIPSSDSFEYGSDGMYCLLEDDKLIEKVTISAYQDHSATDDQQVKAIIIVNTRITAGLWGNLNFI